MKFHFAKEIKERKMQLKNKKSPSNDLYEEVSDNNRVGITDPILEGANKSIILFVPFYVCLKDILIKPC